MKSLFKKSILFSLVTVLLLGSFTVNVDAANKKLKNLRTKSEIEASVIKYTTLYNDIVKINGQKYKCETVRVKIKVNDKYNSDLYNVNYTTEKIVKSGKKQKIVVKSMKRKTLRKTITVTSTKFIKVGERKSFKKSVKITPQKNYINSSTSKVNVVKGKTKDVRCFIFN